MIKSAQLYEEKIKEQFLNIFYNEKYLYYFGRGYATPEIAKDTFNRRQYVSVNDNNEIVGYISYAIDWEGRQAYDLGIINFTDEPSYTFIKDVIQAVEDIFVKTNLNRLEWRCYADNPAARGYNKFIKRHGGCIAGYYRQDSLLSDGIMHDSIMFEILKEEFKR